MVVPVEVSSMLRTVDGPLELPISEIGDSLARFRVVSPHAQQRLDQSLRTYGQLSPAVVLSAANAPYELIDGFKRLRVVRALPGATTFKVQRLTLGPRAAKVAVVQLNQAAGRV